MNRLVKYTLIALGLNALSFLVFAIPLLSNSGDPLASFLIAVALAAFSLIVQFIVSLVLLSNPRSRETGKAMLLTIGVILLVGLSVCSSAWL